MVISHFRLFIIVVLLCAILIPFPVVYDAVQSNVCGAATRAQEESPRVL